MIDAAKVRALFGRVPVVEEALADLKSKQPCPNDHLRRLAGFVGESGTKGRLLSKGNRVLSSLMTQLAASTLAQSVNCTADYAAAFEREGTVVYLSSGIEEFLGDDGPRSSLHNGSLFGGAGGYRHRRRHHVAAMFGHTGHVKPCDLSVDRATAPDLCDGKPSGQQISNLGYLVHKNQTISIEDWCP